MRERLVAAPLELADQRRAMPVSSSAATEISTLASIADRAARGGYRLARGRASSRHAAAATLSPAPALGAVDLQRARPRARRHRRGGAAPAGCDLRPRGLGGHALVPLPALRQLAGAAAARAPDARAIRPSASEIELPLRGKPLRDKIVLRLIAVDRAFHFLVLGALGVLVLVFSADRAHAARHLLQSRRRPAGRRRRRPVPRQPRPPARARQRSSRPPLRTCTCSARCCSCYAAVEGDRGRRPVVPAALGRVPDLPRHASLLPLEIYEIANRATASRSLAFVINVAVVIYLLLRQAPVRPARRGRRRRGRGRARPGLGGARARRSPPSRCSGPRWTPTRTTV